MTHGHLRLALLVVIFATAFGAAQTTPSPAAILPLGSAVINDFKGEVWVTAPQQPSGSAAQKGQLLGPNTMIETKKGSILLDLADGSQILVKPNSRLILHDPEESKGSFLEQLIGKIVAKVKKRTGNEPPFKMGTPSAVITVRGTQFLVEVTNKQRTFVQVYEGLVEVESFNGIGHPVYLSPGFVTQVSRNTPPENPRRPLDEIESGGSSADFSGKSGEHDLEQRGTRQTTPSSGSGGEGPDY